MKLYFLCMRPAAGTRQKQVEKRNFPGCFIFLSIMLFTGATSASDAHAEIFADNGFKAAPGHDETGGVGDREKQDWWLRGNNFQTNHAKIGDVKVGVDKFKFRMEYDDYRWLTIGAGYRGSGVWAQNAQNNYRDQCPYLREWSDPSLSQV